TVPGRGLPGVRERLLRLFPVRLQRGVQAQRHNLLRALHGQSALATHHALPGDPWRVEVNPAAVPGNTAAGSRDQATTATSTSTLPVTNIFCAVLSTLFASGGRSLY